jgi:hypothetical protein
VTLVPKDDRVEAELALPVDRSEARVLGFTPD